MPNPKSGTITFDLERAIKNQGRRVEFKVDKGGSSTSVRQSRFESQQLVENRRTLLDAINRARPSVPRASTSAR